MFCFNEVLRPVHRFIVKHQFNVKHLAGTDQVAPFQDSSNFRFQSKLLSIDTGTIFTILSIFYHTAWCCVPYSFPTRNSQRCNSYMIHHFGQHLRWFTSSIASLTLKLSSSIHLIFLTIGNHTSTFYILCTLQPKGTSCEILLLSRGIQFCRRIISSDGLRFDPRRINDIQNLDQSITGAHLQHFVCAM